MIDSPNARPGKERYILGIDLGGNSVGWAALRAASGGADGELVPTGILAAGARVFEAGVEGNTEQGKEESRCVARRAARLLRRRHERARRRLDFIWLRLQAEGLLPPIEEELPPEFRDQGGKKRFLVDRSREARAERARRRHEALNRLDDELWEEARRLDEENPSPMPGTGPRPRAHHLHQRMLYFLRAAALDPGRNLSLYAVGRALFNLAQRRGFLSNRRADRKTEKEEELGQVKEAIDRLGKDMAEKGCRTLAEYFLRFPAGERVRGRWTARAMYEEEFRLIWEAQAKRDPGRFTEEFRQRLHRAIFRQRPLKSAAGLIGECLLEPGRRRIPMAFLDYQRFRILQKVNDLRILGREPEALSAEERRILLDRLEEGDLTFREARKLLGLKKEEKLNFDEAEGGETRFAGNRTAKALMGVFGPERWRAMSAQERDAVVEDWHKTVKNQVLERRGLKRWGLDAAAAKKFSELSLEDGYGGLSRQAIRKLLPEMEKGTPYMAAAKAAYPERESGGALDRLPPVGKTLPGLRNPAVARALNELRRVVNAIVRRYGKPEVIRIELARELRKNRRARETAWKRNRDREKMRQAAGKSLLDERGDANPTRPDIEKILLWEECGRQCPYTGRMISVNELFGKEVEVEHIVPFSVSLDNSYLNKTLCFREANQSVPRLFPGGIL